MPTAPNELVTVPAIPDRSDLLVRPATTTPLRIPRRRAAGVLPLFRKMLGACTSRPRQERPLIHPDYPRQETVVDRVVRSDPYLYIHSLSG